MIFIFSPGYGKWICMFLGMLRGGFRGAFVGFIVGALLDSLFVRRAPTSSHKSEPSVAPPPSALQQAYAELGLSPTATDDEVRAAYKKMAMLYHPDRVASLGEDIRRTAEQKLQRVNAARDYIYKVRGIK